MFFKRFGLFLGVCMGLLIFGAVLYRLFNPPVKIKMPEWTLHDDGAKYVIHGSSNFGSGGPYYLYWYKDNKTFSAYILPDSPIDLTHYTDQDVTVQGDLRPGRGKLPEVYIVQVRYNTKN